MEEVILLSTSLRRGGMKPMEPVFFILAFALSIFVASVHMCEMQTQAQM